MILKKKNKTSWTKAKAHRKNKGKRTTIKRGVRDREPMGQITGRTQRDSIWPNLSRFQ